MDLGIVNAARSSVPNPLPQSWTGRADAPLAPPSWAISATPLTGTQLKNLLAQIGYDLSLWDYEKIGNNNELGRYQFGSEVLEEYGLLAAGSNAGLDSNNCVNYRASWQPNRLKSSAENYIFGVGSLREFLLSKISQDYFGYQLLADLYTELTKIDAIIDTDTPDIVAGMIYVSWMLGTGAGPNNANPQGTGAYAWRYYNAGNGADYYNSGRYAVAVLSQ